MVKVRRRHKLRLLFGYHKQTIMATLTPNSSGDSQRAASARRVRAHAKLKEENITLPSTIQKQ